VTSSTRTGLTNGTPYYFVVIPKDAFGNRIATSSEVSSTPVSSGSGGGGGGGGVGGFGGGGGGGGIAGGATIVQFSGRAYPRSTVTLLKDAQVAASTVAGSDASFFVSLNNLSSGNYMFSVYGEDKDGNRSSLLTFPVGVTDGATTNVGGIFLAPTISTDKSEVKRGDNIAIVGQSASNAKITVSINSDEEYFGTTTSDGNGVYLYNFDTSELEYGSHSAKSKAAVSSEISSFSKAVVNLIDFSVVAYWYKRENPPAKADLNADGKVDLRDFSIMAFNWTG